MSREIRIGTRGSELALRQAHLVAEGLQGLDSEICPVIVPIVTSGDCRQRVDAGILRDKRGWIDEIENAVQRGHVDLAVHSGKDVPLDYDPSTAVVPILRRADPRDLLLCRDATAAGFSALADGAVVGTSSLRRKAQILRLKPGLRVQDLRGNLPTRLKRLAEGDFDAIVVAAAGCDRLGLSLLRKSEISVEELMPAAAQGTLAAQFRKDAGEIRDLVSGLLDPETQGSFCAERACIAGLGADCHSAIGAYARAVVGGEMVLSCRVLLPDGSKWLEDSIEGRFSCAESLGLELARRLLEGGAGEILERR